MQYVISIFKRLSTHGQIRVFARLLQIEQSRKHNRILSGGPAAVIVDSGVERNAVRQQTLSFTL